MFPRTKRAVVFRDRGGGIPPLPDIAGLQFRLDFSDISTLYTDSLKTTPVTSDGDVIGAAEDRSGNGRDALQTVAGNKPLYKTGIKNGLSVAQSVTIDALVTTANVPVFASKRGVILYAMLNAGPQPFASCIGTLPGAIIDIMFYSPLSGANKYRWFDNVALYESANFDVVDTWYVQTAHRTGDTTLVYRKNGSITDTFVIANNQPSSRPLGVFSGTSPGVSNLNGYIGEVLVYDGLTVAQVEVLEAYLNAKWNVH